MKKQLLFHAIFFCLFPYFLQAQFSYEDVRFWTGSGSDTSILVISFNDGTWDSSYAWGYLHNGATGEDMLNAVAQADANLSINITNGFLNDLIYHRHEGIGGTNGFYWSTWDGPDLASMSTNLGLNTAIGNGDWFGCSFTDFNPAVPPSPPIGAYNPHAVSSADINFWFGTGKDTAIMIIDFKDAQDTASFAWGYLFNDSIEGLQMLQDLAVADTTLSIAASGGTVSEIYYKSFAGITTQSNGWLFWNASNFGDWDSAQASVMIKDGMLFACTFSAKFSLERPDYPKGARLSTGVLGSVKKPEWNIYPVPASNYIFLDVVSTYKNPVNIFNISGKLVQQESYYDNRAIDISHLAPGIYFLEFNGLRKGFVKH